MTEPCVYFMPGRDGSVCGTCGVHHGIHPKARGYDRRGPSLPTPTDSLDAAWAAAEAALPEGVELFLTKDVLNPPESRYEVEAAARTLSEGLTGDDWTFTANFPAQFATGPTPAAALHALVARLEEAK